jgi:two-component system, cell cycle sensor histidine kinase and response regulator CckA
MDARNGPPGFERYLGPVFDHLFEGIQVVDFEWRYVYLNATAAGHARRGRDGLIGHRMMDAFPGIEEASMFHTLRRCMEERLPCNMVNEFTYPDGRAGWFDLRMSPIPMGVLILSIDVTATKTAEAQLNEATKLEAVGRLAGGVAHDFNNLITVIQGYSEMILEGLGPDAPFRNEVFEIHQASGRAAALTQQLLAFSRRQRLEPRVLDINEVIARMDTLLRRLIGADVNLVTRMNPHAGQVLADPGQLEQVLMNLAINARDAMPDGGELTIETDAVDLDQAYAERHLDAAPGPHVLIAVSDTGTGMDEPTQARIFEPFFSTKEQGKGTGLGLSTVYGIVKQSGGNVWVYSEPGRGTTFKIYLPLAAGPDAAPAPVRPAGPPRLASRSETILLVEDDAAVREFIRNVLERVGYTVLEAGDAIDALELAAGQPHRPDLLLIDLVLPGTTGRDLAQLIRTRHPELRVLFMSGYTDHAIVHRGMLDATSHFIDKPIATDDLLDRVRRVLDRLAPA